MIREIVGRTVIFEGNLLIAIIFALIGSVILFTWLRKGRKSGQVWIDRLLLCLRLVVMVVISLYFLRPVIVSKFEVKNVKPMAMLIDSSGSMIHRNSNETSRFDEVRTVLEKYGNRLVSHQNNLFFDLFSFSHVLEAKEARGFSGLKVQGGTDYNSSLSMLLSGNKEYSGVIAVTDNAADREFQLDRKALMNRGIPLYWVTVDWEAGRKNDLFIKSFQRKDHFLIDEDNSIDLVLGRTGLQKEADLELHENGVKVFEKAVLFDGGDTLEEKIVFKTANPGENWYQIVLKPKGPDGCVENNVRGFYCQVIKSRISILLVASPTGLDVKFLKAALEKNTVARTFYYPGALKGRKVKIREKEQLKILDKFPDSQFMEKIDVVLLGLSADMDLSAKDIAVLEGHLNSGKGGFFVFPQDRQLSARKGLEKFIPFQDPEYVEKTSRLKISLLGMHHPVMRLSSSMKINEITWKNFPGIKGYFKYSKLKGGAIPLLINDLSINPADETGFLIYFKSGVSDILFLNAKGIWKWAFTVLSYRNEAEEFSLLINNIISYLGKLKEFENVRLELSSNYLDLTSALYSNPPRCTLKVLDKQLSIVENPVITSTLFKLDPSTGKHLEIRTIEFKLQQPGLYSSNVTVEEAGQYQIKVQVNFGDEKHEKTVRFSADTPLNEYNIFTPNAGFMDKLVESSGGKKIQLKEFDKLFDLLECSYDLNKESTKSELFSESILWVILLMSLFIDWSLRKRYGL